jgi:DNA invertase Pin-like site-specific DNA recombinase
VRVAIYARVSTSDKDQNPETQLGPLREFIASQGWTTAGEYVDQASANDLRGRRAWRTLLELASKRKVDVLLVWKLDRAFRSVSHATTTLEDLRRWGVGLRSYSEAWLDTSGSSPVGDLIFHVLAAVAQFERSLIAERVRAGMARARREGRHLGRPRAVNGEWAEVQPLLANGTMTPLDAATRLHISRSTVYRLLHLTRGTVSGEPGAPNPT